VPDVHGTFAYADKRLTTNASAIDSTGHPARGRDGTLPINLALSGVTGSRMLDEPIDVKVVSDSVPLALVPNLHRYGHGGGRDGARQLHRGRHAQEAGDARRARAVPGAVPLGATGTMLDDVNGTVRMTGDSVYVDSIAGSANGPVRLTGTMAIGNWREPTFNLTFHAQDAELLNTDRGEVHANADLKITGPFAHANVTGRVRRRARRPLRPRVEREEARRAGDPQLFSVVDTSVALERELFPAESPLFEGLGVDVELSVERGTWVRSQRRQRRGLSPTGRCRCGAGDALTLTGAVNADRGEYTFLSKRFQITRGSALFIGSPDLNPTLQVTAEYQVKQATNVTNIRVLVGGTVQKPRISLESDAQPPLSQSDLLSYLAFGASTGSLLQVGSTARSGGLGARRDQRGELAARRRRGRRRARRARGRRGALARVDVFNVTPGDIPIEQGQRRHAVPARHRDRGGPLREPEHLRLGRDRRPASRAARRRNAPEQLVLRSGRTVQYRTNKGYRFETSLTPRYILEPADAGRPDGVGDESVRGVHHSGVEVLSDALR
jgi:translocation and assembly module TamB